jgi:hypothetical protein
LRRAVVAGEQARRDRLKERDPEVSEAMELLKNLNSGDLSLLKQAGSEATTTAQKVAIELLLKRQAA